MESVLAQAGSFVALVGICVYLIRTIVQGKLVPARELAAITADRDYYRSALVEAVEELTRDREFRVQVLKSLHRQEERDGVILAMVQAIKHTKEGTE